MADETTTQGTDEVLRLLVQLRQRRDLTQQALAQRIGIDRTQLCRWERGTRRVCLDDLQRWAHALGAESIDAAALAAVLCRPAVAS